jgi:hypothetical protein
MYSCKARIIAEHVAGIMTERELREMPNALSTLSYESPVARNRTDT